MLAMFAVFYCLPCELMCQLSLADSLVMDCKGSGEQVNIDKTK